MVNAFSKEWNPFSFLIILIFYNQFKSIRD